MRRRKQKNNATKKKPGILDMSEKVKKTLYIPDWAVELLDHEGERYDGPGVVVGAAILAFCKKPESERADILKDFRNEEIAHAYHVGPVIRPR